MAIVLAAAAVVLVVRGSSTEGVGCGEPFDARGWKRPESREGRLLRGSVRLPMAEKLERCRTLDGRTRAGVRALLGRPEYRDPYPRRPDEGGPCFDLGPQPELGGLDNRVLCLRYDRAGRVERASVGTF